MKEQFDDPHLRLAELRHRLANSFQLISSLIRLRLNQATDPEGRRHLSWLLDVVTALGLLQERLAGSYGGNFEHYVADAASFWTRFGEARGVEVTAEAEAVVLLPETASTLAIIINELVTNAMNHAFPHERSGSIAVRLKRASEQWLELVVEDDGVGIPKGNDTQGHGLELVRSLARQLGGVLSIESGAGATVRISIPLSPTSPPGSGRH